MLIGRHDIVGDLARLHREFVAAAGDAERLLSQLELLAAVAVQLGMSHNIVGQASGIARERIDAVLQAKPTLVGRRAVDYERHPNGIVCLRDDQDGPGSSGTLDIR